MLVKLDNETYVNPDHVVSVKCTYFGATPFIDFADGSELEMRQYTIENLVAKLNRDDPSSEKTFVMNVFDEAAKREREQKIEPAFSAGTWVIWDYDEHGSKRVNCIFPGHADGRKQAWETVDGESDSENTLHITFVPFGMNFERTFENIND